MIDDLKTKSSIELIEMVIVSLNESEQKELDFQQLVFNFFDICSKLNDELDFTKIKTEPSMELMKLYLLSLDINENVKRDADLNDVIFILTLLFKYNDDLLDELQPGYI